MPDLTAVHELIAKRWSPRAFTSQAIPPDIFRSLFEAARWAASSFNEQPWRFVVATKDEPEEFARLLKLLVPPNRAWAQTAWALGITAGKKTFTANGAPDRFGLHDAGAALSTLALQATAVGLHAHGMGGFDAAAARLEFAIPEDFDVGAAFAVGYVDGPEDPPPGRTRKPLAEI
ncbi:MAG: nitroreductase family protein, partial [Acidobacteriota bacterium]|nr:nitroreductase family protein [Acidobacteriota bacterium]